VPEKWAWLSKVRVSFEFKNITEVANFVYGEIFFFVFYSLHHHFIHLFSFDILRFIFSFNTQVTTP